MRQFISFIDVIYVIQSDIFTNMCTHLNDIDI